MRRHYHTNRLSENAGMHIIKILAYLLAMMFIFIIAMSMDKDKVPESTGTLGDRFDAVATMEYGGDMLNYRENQVENILLIGVDRADIFQTGGDYQGGGQADFLFLLCLDSRNKLMEVVQIDRDTIAEIQIYGAFGNPAGKRTTQICLAQAFGMGINANCENTRSAVSDLLYSIPIDHYIALDMSAIQIINDMLGGVTVTLEEDFSTLDPAMYPGATLTLQGEQAEIFVRTRTEIGSTNAQRMQRQQHYIDSAMNLLISEMEQNLNFIGELLTALENHMVTNADHGWLVNKAYACRRYALGEIITIAGSHKTGQDGFVEFHVDEKALKAVISELYFE